MRQVHSTPKETKPPAIGKKEPLEEGIRIKKRKIRSEEEKAILSRREELIPNGLTESEISKKIEEETGRHFGTIAYMLRGLCKKGKIPVNPNGPERFRDEELESLIRRRAELILAGLSDSEIAKKMAGETGRGFGSVYWKINELRKEGKIPKNPNKREMNPFNNEQLADLLRRREELIQAGMTDRAIAKKIAKETGRRGGSVHSRIFTLKKDGKIRENPNIRSKQRFSAQEEESLINRREELIAEGMIERALSIRIAEETGRLFGSIEKKLMGLLEKGTIRKNPNVGMEYEAFTELDVALLIKRREEMLAKGENDCNISEKLTHELGRDARSVRSKIYSLSKDGKIQKNPNNRGWKPFTEQEEALLILRREELIPTGMTDGEISRSFSQETGISFGSTCNRLFRLVKEEKIPANPNRRPYHGKMGEEERSQALDAILDILQDMSNSE